MTEVKFHFPGNSALFRATKDLIFVKGKLAFKVNYLNTIDFEENDAGNYKRIIDRIFYLIKNNYNNRIEKYNLSLNKIDSKENLELKKLKLITSKPGESKASTSGYAQVFPKTFVCDKCSDFKVEYNLNDISKNCQVTGCSGIYKQVSVVKFCEKCGHVDQLFYQCQNNKKHRVKLYRKKADDLTTWYFQCATCKGKKVDILGFRCFHEDFVSKVKLLDDKASNFKPLTVREGAIFIPSVYTMVDLPSSNKITDQALNYISLGLAQGLIKDEQGNIRSLESINGDYELYNSSLARKRFGKDMSDLEWMKQCNVYEIEQIIQELKDTVIDSRNLNYLLDYLSLASNISEDHLALNFSNYLSTIVDDKEKQIKTKLYQKMKEDLNIDEITYIENVKLLNINYGYIRGVNKFYEDGFKPHFEPNWSNKFDSENNKFEAYVFPFETEGILIRLDMGSILKWLEKNNIRSFTKDELDNPGLTILKLNDDLIEDFVFPLLHTLSHQIIKLSSDYTGIDIDSHSEIIYPRNGAIFIFSLNNVNIGGFKYLFENAIFELFRKVNTTIDSCIYDPLCTNLKGACFSCLYLSEHVCRYFNQRLDRDLYNAKKRFKVGFWDVS